MGCTRSKLNPKICLSEEAAWIKSVQKYCAPGSSSHSGFQEHDSRNTFGLINVESDIKENVQGGAACGKVYWMDLLEIVVIILVGLFLVRLIYVWYMNSKKRARKVTVMQMSSLMNANMMAGLPSVISQPPLQATPGHNWCQMAKLMEQ